MINALRFIMTYGGEFWWTSRHHRTHLLNVWQDVSRSINHYQGHRDYQGHREVYACLRTYVSFKTVKQLTKTCMSVNKQVLLHF